jgi:iron complex outermembrane recepter protein
MKSLFLGVLSMAVTPLFSQVHMVDTVSLSEVVVTGSKIPQSPGNVTQKIDIINSEEISHMVSGNRNLSEAIMYKAGASVSVLSRNDANWGTYGGIGGKYSTYMLQGVPVDAYVDPMTLDILAIDKIEIQRGAASVLYPNYLSQDFAGNQSPLAGTVNILLKEKIGKPLTTFATSYGSYNTFNGQLFHQGVAENLSYYGGMTYESSDYTNYGTPGSWLNMQKNPEYTKAKVFGNLTWNPSGNNRQKVSVFFNKTFHNGDAGRIYRGFNNDYGIFNAAYHVDLNARINLQAHIGLRQYLRSWQESNFGTIDTLKSNNGVDQTIVPADIAITVRHGNNSLFIAGTDYQAATYNTWSDPLNGYQSYGNKSNAFQTGIYAQEEFRFYKLTLRGGMRYNYIRNNIELVDGGAPGDNAKLWQSFIWSAGIKYNINEDVSLFANAGNSFMPAGLKSTGGTISLSDKGVPGRNGQLPNPDLKPESGIGIDAGSDVYLPFNIKLTARFFHITINDAIIENVVSQNPSQTQSINAGNTTSTGAELEIGQNVTTSLQWFANYTYMKTKVNDGGSVPFAPEHVANAGISYASSFGLQISTYLNYNNGIYDSSDETSRNFFKTGALLNANLTQVLARSESYKVECFGQLYNITNNIYEMPWQFMATGFSIMAGLRATF